MRRSPIAAALRVVDLSRSARRMTAILGLALVLVTAPGCVSTPHVLPDLPASSPAERAEREAIRAEGRKMFEELLALSREVDTTTNRVRTRSLFADLVEKAREGMAKARTPRERVAALNSAFFDKAGLRPIPDAVGLRLDSALDASKNELLASRYLLPQRVLETKQGYCLSFAALYASLAAEFGVRASVVRVPRHVFVRVEDGGERINVELLQGGAHFGDEIYRHTYQVPEKLLANGYHLASQRGPGKVAAQFWANLALGAFVRGDLAEARARMGRFEAQYPDDSIVHTMRGLLASVTGDSEGANTEFGRAIAIEPEQGSANYALGMMAFERGDWNVARTHLEKAYRGGAFQGAGYASLIYFKQSRGRVAETFTLSPPATALHEPTWTWSNAGKHYTISSQASNFIALDGGGGFMANVIVERRTTPVAANTPSLIAQLKEQTRTALPASGTEELALHGCSFAFRLAASGMLIDACTRVVPHPKRPDAFVMATLSATHDTLARHMAAFEVIVTGLEASLRSP